jgi:PleD family two-component response regulator
VAERVRAFVEQQTIRFENVQFSITLSIGVSTYNPAGFKNLSLQDTIKCLLGHADLGVYDAKEQGRNRVCSRVFSSSLEAQLTG